MWIFLCTALDDDSVARRLKVWRKRVKWLKCLKIIIIINYSRWRQYQFFIVISKLRSTKVLLIFNFHFFFLSIQKWKIFNNFSREKLIVFIYFFKIVWEILILLRAVIEKLYSLCTHKNKLNSIFEPWKCLMFAFTRKM